MDGIIDSVTDQNGNVPLANCLDCHSSSIQESETSEHGQYPVYGATGICGYLDYAAISTPAILIVKDGSGVGNVFYSDNDCSVVGTLNYLTAKTGFYEKYLYYVLKRFNFQPYKTGMAIPHIYFKTYSKAKIFCPILDEQLKIASSLSKLDAKIVGEERILSLLLAQKKFLLSEMFI